EKHLTAVKRIFRYLKDTINMGLRYPKDTGFELTAFSDSDHAGCLDSCKSTSGGIQFLGGDKLVSWSSKKQDCTSMSTAEAAYVSLSACCAQVLWMRTQLTDYGFHFDKIPMHCDSKSAIAISYNPVQHSCTKHIDVRYHFIKEKVEKGIVELFVVGTENQLADLFTKAFPEQRFKYLVKRLGMRCLTLDELESVFMNKESDLENTSVDDRYAEGMHTVLPLMTRNYMPSGPDVEIGYSKFTYGPKHTSVDESDSKPSEYASCESDSNVKITTSMLAPIENAPKVICEPKVWTDAPIIVEYESDSDDDSVENVKEKGTPNHNPKIEKQDRNDYTRKGLGYDFTRKACFVYGSFSHLIRDRDFHEKRMAKQAELTKSKNKISQALEDESWVDAMQEELLQFQIQKVWILVDFPFGKKAIRTKWVYRNKKDKREVVVRNKARLVAQGLRQEEGIDYDEVFSPVARNEAIRIFLAFASYMGFIVYQMDVKSAFLYGTIDEEDKYVAEILKKFDFLSVKTASTPIETRKPLVKDKEVADVDVHLYRYLKGQPKLGLWYPKVSSFDLEAYSDSDYVGANLDRKSTTRGCQFLGRRLISWQCKKQTIVATSTTEAEYVAAAHYCGQVLWIQNQLLDYGFNFMNIKIYIDNESTICIVKNPVCHSKTKHIEIRHHFIRDAYEKKLIQVLKIHTDDNVADLLTKAFDVSSKELASPKQTALVGLDLSKLAIILNWLKKIHSKGLTSDTNGMIKVLPLKIAEEVVAREMERKARTILLMALPKDHLAKFHKMTDAKEMWEAIKSRFGGNDESKKMQKYLLKQQFEGFFVSALEGLHKGYDRFKTLLSQLEIHGAGVLHKGANQKFLRSLPSSWSQVALIMRTKPGLDTLSFDDLYNNLRVFEHDVKGTTTSSSSSNTQNVAFMSADNTSSTYDINDDDIEEMDLKWQEMWEVIKSRFGGNDESKKMQKYLLKQQFEGFSVSTLEGLHKGYDSFDDLYNNLRVFERDVKGTTVSSSSSNTKNMAFVFADNTSSTNDVSTAYSVSSPSVTKSQKEGSVAYTGEINDDDLEEMNLKWQVAMISMRIKKFDKRTGRKLQFDTKDTVGFDKTKVKCFNCHKIGHFARDCRAKGNQDRRRRDGGYNGNKARDNGRRLAYQDDSKALVTIDGEAIDWSGHVEEDTQNFAMMAYSSSNSGSDNELTNLSPRNCIPPEVLL
nr:putative ribonuclease H-like domain-containing protein [Tanacetum cinerariifolium]